MSGRTTGGACGVRDDGCPCSPSQGTQPHDNASPAPPKPCHLLCASSALLLPCSSRSRSPEDRECCSACTFSLAFRDAPTWTCSAPACCVCTRGTRVQDTEHGVNQCVSECEQGAAAPACVSVLMLTRALLHGMPSCASCNLTRLLIWCSPCCTLSARSACCAATPTISPCSALSESACTQKGVGGGRATDFRYFRVGSSELKGLS